MAISIPPTYNIEHHITKMLKYDTSPLSNDPSLPSTGTKKIAANINIGMAMNSSCVTSTLLFIDPAFWWKVHSARRKNSTKNRDFIAMCRAAAGFC